MSGHRVFIPDLVPQVYGSKSIDPSLVQLGQDSIWLDAQRAKPSIDPGMPVLMLREISLMACVRATYPQHFAWWHWPALRHVKYFGIMFLSTGPRHFPELGSNAVPGPVASAEHHIWFFCCELLCSRLASNQICKTQVLSQSWMSGPFLRFEMLPDVAAFSIQLGSANRLLQTRTPALMILPHPSRICKPTHPI